MIGVATGRGKSAGEVLRDKLPRKYWHRILMGYYNGAYVTTLNHGLPPDATAEPCEALQTVASELTGNEQLAAIARCTLRKMQITVEPTGPVTMDEAWQIVQETVAATDIQQSKVLRSSHSIDIVPTWVSKRELVSRAIQLTADGSQSTILCIGDKGRWPGNDFELLQWAHSLSVDEVSLDPRTCWNLAVPGRRGPQAAVDYLAAIRVHQGVARISIQDLGHRML
jgi:hydroxymethylpyrimidine pyrophosphatase-like HAD family hydrolase